MRLDPFYPAWWEFYLGNASGQYEEVIVALKRGATRNPDYPAFQLFMAGSYALLGWQTEAKAAVAEVLRINPRFTLRAFAAHVPYRSKIDLDKDLAAFRKAGLPE
jgi:adenylate cyclase